MTTYTLPLALAQEALALTAPYMSTKKVGETTPVLYGVQIVAGSLIATDRYGVARYRDSRIESDETISLRALIPADAVSWVQGIKRQSLRDYAGKHFNGLRPDFGKDPYSIEVAMTGNGVAISLIVGGAVERLQSFDLVGGILPPVERLFPTVALTRSDERVGIDHLSAWQLERLGKTVKILGVDTPMLLSVESNYHRSDKSSPVHVTIPSPGLEVDFLIQPVAVKP